MTSFLSSGVEVVDAVVVVVVVVVFVVVVVSGHNVGSCCDSMTVLGKVESSGVFSNPLHKRLKDSSIILSASSRSSSVSPNKLCD